VEFGHHREVVDDMLRQARRPKFFAPLGSWRVAIADRPAQWKCKINRRRAWQAICRSSPVAG
jgi:hypothetical protein